MARKTTGKKSLNRHSARADHKPRGERNSAGLKKPGAAPGMKLQPAAPVKKPIRKGITIKTPTPAQARANALKLNAEKSQAAAPKPVAGNDVSKSLGGKGKRTRTVAEAASNISADSKGYVFINGRRVRMISTKGQLPVKKPRNNGSAGEGPAADAVPIKSIKTKLSRKELNYYRDLLVLKRRELVGDLHAMENEALRSGGGNLSHMPIHMADIGTDTYDQDFMLGLAAAERDQLREIDSAIQRIEDRTYGVCQMTGKPIPKARLDAKPWAKYTIEAARKLEGQWGR